MRALWPLLPFVIGVGACAAAGDDGTTGPDEEIQSASSSCSLPRAQILDSVSGARRVAIQRGFGWLDQKVPYSQSAQHEGYRTDCSGFVSMCWDIGESSNTSAMVGGAFNSKLGSYDELVPADALLRNGHVMLFVGWNDAAHTGACVLEQASTKSDMQFRVHSTPSLLSGGYKAVRAKKLVGDTSSTSPSTSPSPEPDASGEKTPSTAPSTPAGDSPAPGADKCQPRSPAEACGMALEKSGVECGTIDDGCGGTVSCDKVPSFGCNAGETCNAKHQCEGTACVPRSAIEICAEAKLLGGVTCGSLPDGCGGIVSCDTVPLFGCKPDQTCSPTHQCVSTAAPPAPSSSSSQPPPSSPSSPSANKQTPASPASPQPTSAEPQTGDPGDENEPDPNAKRTVPKLTSDSGCSASPHGRANDAPSGLGLALAISLLRRRARRASPRSSSDR
jgi:hypothetical protein